MVLTQYEQSRRSDNMNEAVMLCMAESLGLGSVPTSLDGMADTVLPMMNCEAAHFLVYFAHRHEKDPLVSTRKAGADFSELTGIYISSEIRRKIVNRIFHDVVLRKKEVELSSAIGVRVGLAKYRAENGIKAGRHGNMKKP